MVSDGLENSSWQQSLKLPWKGDNHFPNKDIMIIAHPCLFYCSTLEVSMETVFVSSILQVDLKIFVKYPIIFHAISPS